jgi:hypothetical protein
MFRSEFAPMRTCAHMYISAALAHMRASARIYALGVWGNMRAPAWAQKRTQSPPFLHSETAPPNTSNLKRHSSQSAVRAIKPILAQQINGLVIAASSG